MQSNLHRKVFTRWRPFLFETAAVFPTPSWVRDILGPVLGTPPVKSRLLGFRGLAYGLASPDSKNPRNSPLGPNYDFHPRKTRNLMHFDPTNARFTAFFSNS
ncbi:hypothetical protein DMR_09430 [Solidesulfovibrio magneticus RS-1]|uniref:Uncharacterized protein n=1 Tax=Solidesulfovibrio magneticus (strain ATCC 700980 / DSM 13731 / RS-1) TaxID=573370 RepID=C4XKP3_SOLM1|nr:hypothetical protein DMR_09430 [Solidesulfovibrio magneticus RS-1]